MKKQNNPKVGDYWPENLKGWRTWMLGAPRVEWTVRTENGFYTTYQQHDAEILSRLVRVEQALKKRTSK